MLQRQQTPAETVAKHSDVMFCTSQCSAFTDAKQPSVSSGKSSVLRPISQGGFRRRESACDMNTEQAGGVGVLDHDHSSAAVPAGA